MLSKQIASKVMRTQVAQRSFADFAKAPVRVAVTGATGNIAYATAFRIAA